MNPSKRDVHLMGYIVLAGVVFGVNVLPAFGPPTWAVLVFFRLQSSLAAVPLVLIGALAAASGRLVLASASRALRGRLSKHRIASLQAARDAVAGGRRRALAGLGLFALSPVPSAQLFVAAGLLAAPLVPLTAAFFAGRLVSYSLYVAAASAAKHSFGSVLQDAFSSPVGIVLQLLMLAGLLALVRVDWARILGASQASGSDQPVPGESTEPGPGYPHPHEPQASATRAAPASSDNPTKGADR